MVSMESPGAFGQSVYLTFSAIYQGYRQNQKPSFRAHSQSTHKAIGLSEALHFSPSKMQEIDCIE